MGSQKIKKTEGGAGGKRGHSNMEHWEFTEEIKRAAKIQRRAEDKKLSRRGIQEHASRQTGRKDSELPPLKKED